MTGSANEPLVDARGVYRVFGHGPGRVEALSGVDLAVRAGEMVALMGPSGSGKSTLIQILGLLDRADAGSYRLNGADTGRMSARTRAAFRGRRIGFVFQGIHLLPRLSALANVELPMAYARMPQALRRDRARSMLERTGVLTLAARMPSGLSGGQAQRVAIARAVAPGPDLLLADEPTGALDRAAGRQVLGVFQALNLDLGLTIVMVTHDPAVARHATRVVTLEDGRVVEDHPIGAAERLSALMEVDA